MIDTGMRVAPDARMPARLARGPAGKDLPVAGPGMMIAVPWPGRLAPLPSVHGFQGGSHAHGSHEHSTILSAAPRARGVSWPVIAW
jgi:hypothetical protein